MYTANRVIIYYLPPFTRTSKIHWSTGVLNHQLKPQKSWEAGKFITLGFDRGDIPLWGQKNFTIISPWITPPPADLSKVIRSSGKFPRKTCQQWKKDPWLCGVYRGMRSYPVVWGLKSTITRIAIKQPVQEISNRTHRTDPSTWVSNSSIATYLGVNLGIWSHSIFVEKPGFHGKYPVPGCFVDHFAHVSKNLLPAVSGMSPSAIVASRDCWKIPWVSCGV